ncbi:MAG: potassium channel protein [Calditrichaeota bacterium]|nr:MAG: potassium channel protein [Calditrichota bacterium]
MAVRQIRTALLILALVILAGTTGYMLIEGWAFLESFYMTIISITTTGFAEVRPLSPAGRLFTVGVIIAGFSTIAYIGGRAAQLLIESRIFWRRRVNRKIGELQGHYIVCGFGRLGKQIAEELHALNQPFVVIEKDPARIDDIAAAGYLFINGDATQDEVLQTAGIDRAAGLIAVLPSDADNVFATLSAKVLNPRVFVVSRAIEDGTEIKLMRAGADRIVNPYEIGASRMVHMLVRPAVVDFMDIVYHKKGVDLHLEEIAVNENSPLIHKSLAESSIRQTLNIIIVAIFRQDGRFIYNPTSTEKILPGDRLIAIGASDSLASLANLCAQGEK